MNLKNIFKKKEVKALVPKQNLERDVRELLRQNLNVLEMDIFYEKDPLMSLTKEQRLVYLKKFADMYIDEVFQSRVKFMISKQAQKTLWNSQDGVQDIAGAMEINGMSTIIDEVKRLANLHLKESAIPDSNPLDKFSIIPKTG